MQTGTLGEPRNSYPPKWAVTPVMAQAEMPILLYNPLIA
jgi:hypothetical protein